MQGVRVQSLVRELDPTCCAVAKKKRLRGGWQQHRNLLYLALASISQAVDDRIPLLSCVNYIHHVSKEY